MIFLAILVLIEYSVGITHNPRMTVYIALAMLALAIIFGLLFTRKSFCRYCCPVGIMSGLYAIFAPFELRSISRNICDKCQTKDCIRGNTKGIGCPVFEFPAEMKTNSHCILCTECIKTCPYDNIGINIRPFGRDIGHMVREFAAKTPERKGEGLLIILLILFSLFHNFYTTQVGAPFNEYLLNTLQLSQFWVAGLFVAIIFIISFIIFSMFKNATAYFYAFLPLQMLTHLGLTIRQLSQNIDGVSWSLSDPLGMNWNILGITSAPRFIFDAATIWQIEIWLGVIGSIFGFYFIINIAKGKKFILGMSLFLLLALLLLNIWISKV
jgi:ferredoxin